MKDFFLENFPIFLVPALWFEFDYKTSCYLVRHLEKNNHPKTTKEFSLPLLNV